MYIGKSPVIGNFVKLDAISVVNGQAAYTMQNGGSNFTDYESVNQFLVSLNGTIQAPTDSFTVSGSTLTFASNLATGDVIDFVMVFGNSLSAGVPTDATVSTAKIVDSAVTNSKVASSIINSQTAETSIADADEVLIYDSSASALRKMTKSNFVSGVGGDNTPAFFAYMSANQTGVADVTFTTITFDSESIDTDNAFNTSNYTFTVPSGEGGKYVFGLRINAYFYSDKAWQFMQNLYINGSERIELGVIDEPSNDNSRYGGTCTEKVILTLAEGDTVLAQVYGNTRGNANFQISGGGSARKSTYFYGYKLIGL